jgi:hypothetical protein
LTFVPPASYNKDIAWECTHVLQSRGETR